MQSKKLLAVVLAVLLVGSTVAFTTLAELTPDHQTQEAEVSQDSAFLRVVHASPDAPAVDVEVDNETVLSDVEFGNVSDYLTLEAGTYNVSVVTAENETVVFEGEVTLEARSITTVAASGEVSEDANTTFEPVLYNDNAFTPAENESAISVVHLSPDAPAVDVTTDNGSVVLAENVTFQNASDYVSVPAGNYTVEIRAANETNNGSIVTTVDVSLASGEAYSAFALGYLNPDDAPADTPFEVVLTEDATLSVHLPSDDETMANETTVNETTVNETTENETTVEVEVTATTNGNESAIV